MHFYTFRPADNYSFPKFGVTGNWVTEKQIASNISWNRACIVDSDYNGTFTSQMASISQAENQGRNLVGNMSNALRISHYFKHDKTNSPKPAWMTELFTVYEARQPIMVMVLDKPLTVDASGNVTGAPVNTLYEGVAMIANVLGLNRRETIRNRMKYSWTFVPTAQLSDIVSVMTLEVST
jgi:hypothetical protein